MNLLLPTISDPSHHQNYEKYQGSSSSTKVLPCCNRNTVPQDTTRRGEGEWEGSLEKQGRLMTISHLGQCRKRNVGEKWEEAWNEGKG